MWLEETMANKEKEEVKINRKYSVDYYLRTTDLSGPLQQVMKEMYKGVQKTLEDWKLEDQKINQRRC